MQKFRLKSLVPARKLNRRPSYPAAPCGRTPPSDNKHWNGKVECVQTTAFGPIRPGHFQLERVHAMSEGSKRKSLLRTICAVTDSPHMPALRSSPARGTPQPWSTRLDRWQVKGPLFRLSVRSLSGVGQHTPNLPRPHAHNCLLLPPPVAAFHRSQYGPMADAIHAPQKKSS